MCVYLSVHYFRPVTGGWGLQEAGGVGGAGLLLRPCYCVFRAGDIEEGCADDSGLSEVIL